MQQTSLAASEQRLDTETVTPFADVRKWSPTKNNWIIKIKYKALDGKRSEESEEIQKEGEEGEEGEENCVG